jgi:hypothetical protein
MLAGRPQHDDPYACIVVERLEHQPQLVALGHRNDVERRPVQDHVAALAHRIDVHTKAVQGPEARIGESQTHLAVPCWRGTAWLTYRV